MQTLVVYHLVVHVDQGLWTVHHMLNLLETNGIYSLVFQVLLHFQVNWHLHFSIPSATLFSGCVQEAINTGVVTAKARKEIIQVKLHMDEEIDEEEYEEALEKLRELGKHKKGVDRKELKHLMEVTKLRHHNWIRRDRPLIQEILEKFPCLATSKWVS